MERIQSEYLFNPDINAGKMIFLSGPRQVGKTFFVRKRLKELKNEKLYFNWDDPYVRREYVKNPHFLKSYLAAASTEFPLIAFDEINKHKNWKNILKGLYDIHCNEAQIIITGSARLDYFKSSGDSLVGRYFSFRLLPLGVAEAASDFRHVINDVEYITNPVKKGFLKIIHNVNKTHFRDAFTQWLRFGGFPEPFLKGSDRFSIRWRKNYKLLLTTEDLRDLTRIHDIKGIEQLILILPERVSAPLSINSLREDLQVNHRTISNWLEAYKKIYLVFSLMPWVQSITKAIKKEQKYYFFDWTMVSNPGASYENACAVSLLRLVNRWNELGLGDFELRYIRNIQKYEVDFVLLKNNNPVALFEAKISETQIPKSSIYFANLLNIPYYQIVADDIEITEYPQRRFILPAWRLFPLLG